VGTPIRHVVKVLPKRDGIFTLTAVVSFTVSNQETIERFPFVIAGQGLPDQVAKRTVKPDGSQGFDAHRGRGERDDYGRSR